MEPAEPQAVREVGLAREGVTTIRVRLTAPPGAGLLSGEVTCLASETHKMERADEEGVYSSLQTLHLVPGQYEYTFVLPQALSHARIRADVEKFMPVEHFQYALRAVGGRWAAEDEDVTWDITLEPGKASQERHLVGLVRVDGQLLIPRGLKIDVIQPGMRIEEAGTWQEFYSSWDRRAAICEDTASYIVAPIGPNPKGLFVVSDETVPLWIGLDERPSEMESRVDLELESGGAVELEVVEQGSLRLLPWFDLELEVVVKCDKSRVRSRLTRGMTGADGRYRLAGLPKSGNLIVRSGSLTRPETRRVLLQERLNPGHPDTLRVEVDLTNSETGTLWGQMPLGSVGGGSCFVSETEDTGPLVRYRSVDKQSTGYFTAALEPESQRWSIRATPGRYELWVEIGGRRVTGVHEVELVLGEDTGPIEFPSAELDRVDLVWHSAPAAELELSLQDERGATLYRSRGKLTSVEGRCTLNLPAGNVACLDAVVRGDGFAVAHQDVSSAAPLLYELDLRGDELTTLDLSLSTRRFVDGQLMLARVAPSGENKILAGCELQDGRSVPIPLPAGRYFYRLDDPEHLVCGLVWIDGSKQAIASMIWEGKEYAVAMPNSSVVGPLRVRSVEGIPLDSRVPEFLLEFPVEPLVQARTILANSQGCSWEVH